VKMMVENKQQRLDDDKKADGLSNNK